MTAQQLGPEEVGARVSAILEAAERDARAVIAAAYREAARRPADDARGASPRRSRRSAARVDAIERAISAAPGPSARPRRISPHARRARTPSASARSSSRSPATRATAIARELAGTMAPADVERLLDEVLAG